MNISRISQDGYQTIESTCPDVDRVHLFTGNLVKSVGLFSIPTVGPNLTFNLYHNSLDIGASSDLGIGWRHSAQAHLERANGTATTLTYVDDSGRQAVFEKVSGVWGLQTTSLFRKILLTEVGGGIWQLLHQPSGNIMEFTEIGGSPIIARLTRLLDKNGNQVQYVYTSNQLVQILDPVSNRAINLGWTSGKITSAADPMGNTYLLSYTGNLLTALEMPDGCRIEHTYNASNQVASRTDRAGLSTVYTYTSSKLTKVEAVYSAAVLSSASWSYPGTAVQEVLAHTPPALSLTQVLFTDARSKVWEFRFLSSSMLWREINPLGHHRRFYYDDHQNLLYVSEGFWRKNMDDITNQGQYFGPRDNFNNRFEFYAYDTQGNMTESWDANGLITTYGYDASSRLTSVYPGQAHAGIRGDWRGNYGQEGYVFCAHGDSASDWQKLPSYVSSISKGGTLVSSQLDLTESGLALSTQVIEGVNPAESDRLSSLRRTGFWTSATNTFTFQVQLNQARSFNLSLYSHSLDHQSVAIATPGFEYNEVFGRSVRFTVTDLKGTQVYTLTQNAAGVWSTFPVVGDATHPIQVEVYAPLSTQNPVISAVGFDAFEDRRYQLQYDGSGNLTKVLQPTSDSTRAVSTDISYNADGTPSQVVEALRISGTLSDSRTTSLFYADTARNLTRVQDPLNGATSPTSMEYDLNGRLIRVVDQDLMATNFYYDYRGRLTGTLNDLGFSTSMVYDGRGLLTSVTDARGNQTQLVYTSQRRLWKIIDALGQITQFTYLADGLLASIIDPASNEVTFAYDDVGRQIQVTSPQSEIVMPDFHRETLNAQLRLAYDVWNRLTAVTPPNGNLTTLDNVNVVGAMNLLRNGGAEQESGILNDIAVGWSETGDLSNTLDAPTPNQLRTSADKLEGNYSLPLFVESAMGFLGRIQRKPGGGLGGRYLMEGSAKFTAAGGAFALTAVTRNHSGGLDQQTTSQSLTANTWTTMKARADMPGDAQVARTMPVFHQFRAGIDSTAGATANGYVDALKVQALSQIYNYDGENLDGMVGADGARVTLVRDRFGRVRQQIDPTSRTVTLSYDAQDRLLSVVDSRGLTLSFQYDFLGNLTQFTDSRGLQTVFHYDALDRLVEIIQPDTSQNELFAYSAAGDLTSYTNMRDQVRQFFYDGGHRLIRIDDLLSPTQSISLGYDSNGNLTSLVERNGDRLVMGYDALNRLQLSQRISASGPQWAHYHGYDSRGNRIELKTGLALYGTAHYGTDHYLSASTNRFTATFNARRQMVTLSNALSQQTTFGYDADGRLAETVHPNGTPALKTQNRYDLVGKLLQTSVLQSSTSLSAIDYGYNLSGDRLAQRSIWSSGGNSYRYLLDSSGRLVSETINRFVQSSLENWAEGEHRLTCFDTSANVKLVGRNDNFSPTTLDLQRWELAVTEPCATAVQVTPDNGLHWTTSSGNTYRTGRTMPTGLPSTSPYIGYEYPASTIQVSDNVGHFDGRMVMRHRVPLEGAFDIQVSISDWQTYMGNIGFGVTRDRYLTTSAGSKYPPNQSGAINANGCDLVAFYDDFTNQKNAAFNGVTLTNVNASRLRLKRAWDGTQWNLTAYYHDGTNWVTNGSWVGAFSGQTMYAYLHVSGKYGQVRWTDFLDAVGTQYPISTVDSNQSVNQAAWPCYESQVYDAGQSVSWTRIAWTETLPANTDVRLQIATSSSPSGPWNYVGNAGTSTTYFSTPAGETISGASGRYCRFRAFLYSTDGLNTPQFSNVHLTHGGTTSSRLTTFAYDDTGNLLEVKVTTDAGTSTETRTVNNLNQITTITGGWTLTYDANGCLTQKTNGTAVGKEKWEFSWDVDDRLVQVKKGVYAAGPTLVNQFTVDYTYDSSGRMMTRNDGASLTAFQWDGWDLLSETTGAVTTDYLVPQGVIQSFVRSGNLYVTHRDALGSVRTVTDSSGAVVARLEYSAWGELLSGSFDSVPGGLPFRWIGGLGVRFDAITGMHWMRNRWYDASLQRFISRDPIGLRGGTNQYFYCKNRPSQKVDPTGLLLDGPAADHAVERSFQQYHFDFNKTGTDLSFEDSQLMTLAIFSLAAGTIYELSLLAADVVLYTRLMSRGGQSACQCPTQGVLPDYSRMSEEQWEKLASNASEVRPLTLDQLRRQYPNLQIRPLGVHSLDYKFKPYEKMIIYPSQGRLLEFAVQEEGAHASNWGTGLVDISTPEGRLIEEISAKKYLLERPCRFGWTEGDMEFGRESLLDYVYSYLNGTL